MIHQRRQALRKICELACGSGNQIYGFALPKSMLKSAIKQNKPPTKKDSHWQISAMFIASVVQKKMQKLDKNKGHTVLVVDDNSREMSHFQDEIHDKNKWFDGIYEVRRKTGRKNWMPRNDNNRFNQIINTPFAVKSNHSTLIQVADAICYVYRKYLELITADTPCIL